VALNPWHGGRGSNATVKTDAGNSLSPKSFHQKENACAGGGNFSESRKKKGIKKSAGKGDRGFRTLSQNRPVKGKDRATNGGSRDGHD